MAHKERPTSASFLVGTFNTPELFHFHFDAVRNQLELRETFGAHGNHSWLALGPTRHAGHRNLYATAWVNPTSVAAYSLHRDEDTAKLKVQLQNTAPTRARSGYVMVGKEPCNILYTVGGPTGEVLQLNEADGSFSLESCPDARLQDLDFVQGFVTDAAAAAASSAADSVAHLGEDKVMDFGGLRNGSHSIDLSPNGRIAFVADIGRNCIWVYGVQPSCGKLHLIEKRLSLRENDGPRHLFPHPNGTLVYCLQEHSCVVDIFEVVQQMGRKAQETIKKNEAPQSGEVHLAFRQRVRIIPEGLDVNFFWADEVRLSPGAIPKYMFGSTRGLEPKTKGYVALFELDSDGYVKGLARVQSDRDEVEAKIAWVDMWESPTSGGWANAIEPFYESLGEDEGIYAALTESEEGLVMILKVVEASQVGEADVEVRPAKARKAGDDSSTEGKVRAARIKEVDRIELGKYSNKVRGAATAVWL